MGPQAKESCRTPGPGTYRTPSSWPASQDAHARSARHRAPSWSFTTRSRARVAYIAGMHNVVPTQTAFFQQQAGIEPKLKTNTCTIERFPPVTSSPVLLKGHGGDFPRGHGFPL